MYEKIAAPLRKIIGVTCWPWWKGSGKPGWCQYTVTYRVATNVQARGDLMLSYANDR